MYISDINNLKSSKQVSAFMGSVLSGVFKRAADSLGKSLFGVPTPTPTGSIVFNSATSTLHVYNGTWLTFSTGGE